MTKRWALGGILGGIIAIVCISFALVASSDPPRRESEPRPTRASVLNEAVNRTDWTRNLLPVDPIAMEKLRAQCHGKIDLYVMIRTRDSASYIEEQVAYYLAHGAREVYILDNTVDDSVVQVLEPYIKAKRVLLEKSVFFSSQPSETQKARNGGSLRTVALHYARMAAVSETPTWLLSVDDDEFVLPWRSSAPLCTWLLSTEALRFAMIRFRWRKVGSSGISNKDPAKLDIETYVKMSFNVLLKGKIAFHLNHPSTPLQTWVDQDNLMVSDGSRIGGPFFMHGNNALLTKRPVGHSAFNEHGEFLDNNSLSFVGGNARNTGYTAGLWDVKVSGQCFHYMRDTGTANHRNLMWSDSVGVRNSAEANRKYRDVNQVVNNVVRRWRCAVRRVMAEIRQERHLCRGPYFNVPYVLGGGILKQPTGEFIDTCDSLKATFGIRLNLSGYIPAPGHRTAVTHWGFAHKTARYIWDSMHGDLEFFRRAGLERAIVKVEKP